jgi:precorrin-6B methylase 2
MTLQPVVRAAWRVIAAIKNTLVSNRSRDLRVLAGPARGAVLHTNFRKGTRELLGLYEIELIPYVKGYVRSGDVCYDVGAAGGYYAFAFARLAAPGEVHCFETEPAAADELRTLAARNSHLGSRILVHHARVGGGGAGAGGTSLDTAVYDSRYPAPNVIKIDAEGAEVDILHGAARLLREHHPRLLIEVHSLELEAECDRLLTQAGYQTTVVHNRELMAEHNFRNGHNRWLCAE